MRAIGRLLVAVARTPCQVSVLGLVALGYALLYLWLTGDLSGAGQGGIAAEFPAWERALEARAPFQFEPVGLITLGPLVWTFSPLNLLLALTIGGLVGLDSVAAWRLWRAPRQCAVGSSATGLMAALPALLAGGACCAPLVLIWLGLPIAGAVASLSPLLIPAAVGLLLIGLWSMARRLREEAP